MVKREWVSHFQNFTCDESKFDGTEIEFPACWSVIALSDDVSTQTCAPHYAHAFKELSSQTFFHHSSNNRVHQSQTTNSRILWCFSFQHWSKQFSNIVSDDDDDDTKLCFHFNTLIQHLLMHASLFMLNLVWIVYFIAVSWLMTFGLFSLSKIY